MSDAADILRNLRDIHEPVPPETVSVWWLLLLLIPVALIVTLLLQHREKRKHGQQAPWLEQIRTARKEPPAKACLRLARLLRHISLTSGDPEVHRLTGNAWLDFLDSRYSTRFFTQGAGRVFGESLYTPVAIDSQQLETVCDALEQLVFSKQYASLTPPPEKT